MTTLKPVTYEITQDSHFALWRLVFRRSFVRVFALLAGAILVVLVPVIVMEAITPEIIASIAVGLLAGSAILLIQRLSLRHRASKVYRESVALREQITVSVDDVGFSMNQDMGNVRYKWHDMVKWDEDKNIFAVFPNRMMGCIFPKSQVDRAVVDFSRERLLESGLTKPGKLRR